MKKTTVISTLAVLAVLAAVLTSFMRMRAAEERMPHIALPDAASAELDPAGDVLENLGRAPDGVEITTANVLGLIAAMDRPEEYAAEVRVTLCWEGGESSTQSRVWRSGPLQRVSYSENGVSYHCIIRGEETYLWEQGSADYYTGATGGFSADSAARIPAYEDLAALDPAQVTRCGVAELEGRQCLYVRTEDGSLMQNWYIDLESGLLVRMEEYRSGALKYSAEAVSLAAGPVDGSWFTLPDGKTVTPVS